MRRAIDEPTRAAAWDTTRSITFAELDALAGTLAGLLLAHPLGGTADGPVFVPVLVDRDVESVIAVHAVVRAGLAFSPIDAATPPAMLAELVARMGHPRTAVITRPGQEALLPAGMTALLVPDAPGEIAPPQPVRPDDLALVVFTSGSTGQPKGVLVDWAGLALGAVLEGDAALETPPSYRTFVMTPFTFLEGLVRVLQVGSGPTISLADPRTTDPIELMERVEREGLQVMSLVPSLAAVVLDRWAAGRRLETVKVLNTFGEALDWQQVPRLRNLIAPDAVILAKYGSTEGLSEVLRLTITPDTPIGTGPIPLGRPVTPGRARLVPVGSDPSGPKEIVFVGHLSVGYLGEPGQTALKFGRDDDGTRWWRSGDIATVSPDGIYHRLGRLDDLVKIRGKLVEPSEPQRVLSAIPGIRAALVLPQAGPDGAYRLVAHVEVDDAAALTPGDVRTQLAQALPPHLVPHLLVRHDRLPLNDRGKTDRQALLAAEPVPWLTSAPRPTVGEAERFATSAAGIVLDWPQVSPDDDLWELGLDSLSSVELAVLLSDAGWPGLEPTALLDHRTPAALARLRDDPIAPGPVVRLNAGGTRPPVYCIPGSGGTAMAYRWVADALGADRPVVVIEQRGLHSPGRPDRTVERAAARALDHIEPEAGPEPTVIIGYSGGGVVAYEVAVRMEELGRPVRLVLLDAATATATERQPSPGPLRSAKRAVMRTWLSVLPGRTVPHELRYRAYFHLGGRAALRYRLRPAAFPVTLFHPAGSAFPEHWLRLGDRVRLVEVGGDHYTMLEPPYARPLVESMRPLIDA